MAEINPQNENSAPEGVLLRASYSPALCLICSLKMELEPALQGCGPDPGKAVQREGVLSDWGRCWGLTLLSLDR